MENKLKINQVKSRLIGSLSSGQKKRKIIFGSLCLIAVVVCVLTTFNYYTSGGFDYSPLTWVGYIAAIFFMLLAYLPLNRWHLKRNHVLSLIKSNKVTIIIFLVLSVMFFVTYFANFNHAGWGLGGIYDDAAWDLYETQNYVMEGKPFTAILPVEPPKESLYEYFFASIFQIFGFNLRVFNITLVFLGFFTFLFTALLVQRIFKNHLLTSIAAVITCFFPVIHGNVFCGHRYALAFPLIAASLY